MKKLFSAVLIAGLLVVSFGALAHAAASQCTTISNNNYDTCCSGVASNDSMACNDFINKDSGNATAAQCSNIKSYVVYTNCCSGVPSNDSAACNAYNADNNGQPAATFLRGGTASSKGSSPASPAIPATTTSVNAPLDIHLNNPLSGVSTIPDAINKILSVVIRIALPLIIIMFIWSGLNFIFARGNPEKVKTAKNMFLYTVIGTLLILGAWTITNAIIGTVNSITG